MSRSIRKVIKSTGIAVLMAMLVAAAAALAGTHSASAASANTASGATSAAGAIAYGKLNVSVYAAQGGLSGLSNASVAAFDATGQAVVKGATNAKGSFASYVPQGIYTLKVSAPGYQEFSTQVKITADKTTSLQVTLNAATPAPQPTIAAEMQGKVSVILDNMSMSPVAIQASVLIYTSTGTVVAKGETNAAGTFGSALAPGTYTVLVQADGFNPAKQQVEISSGQLTEVKVALTRVNQ